MCRVHSAGEGAFTRAWKGLYETRKRDPRLQVLGSMEDQADRTQGGILG